MNTTDRFDGHAIWPTISPDQQAEIGATALELLAAWWAQEQAIDPFDGSLLARAADAADILLIEKLRVLMVEAVPRSALDAIDGEPRLPAMLGPVCRECGCSQNDACPEGCAWAEPDLCTACVARERA